VIHGTGDGISPALGAGDVLLGAHGDPGGAERGGRDPHARHPDPTERAVVDLLAPARRGTGLQDRFCRANGTRQGDRRLGATLVRGGDILSLGGTDRPIRLALGGRAGRWETAHRFRADRYETALPPKGDHDVARAGLAAMIAAHTQ